MRHLILATAAAAFCLSSVALPQPVAAQQASVEMQRKTIKIGRGHRARMDRRHAAMQEAPVLQPWMHADVAEAWNSGYTGRGATIGVIDDFSSDRMLTGDIGTGETSQQHGRWTAAMAGAIAPSARMHLQDFSSGRPVALARRGLNVLNLSYGVVADDGYSLSDIRWSWRERSIIYYAMRGRAVVAKSAGNDGVAVGEANASGKKDYLGAALIGRQSAIFVGALNRNGSVEAPAQMTRYSNIAGTDETVQNQFLAVGVETDKIGLRGTSFAAPVVSGYAAILGSKFHRATPTQISNRLLDTARQDTVVNYDPAIYGRGEASLSRALAPVAIR